MAHKNGGHRTSKGGTYRIDKRFTGVGRIVVASGATTLTELRKREALLTSLYDKGRLDLLKGIKASTLSVTEVYAAAREDRLNHLSGDRALINAELWAAVKAWLPGCASAEATQKRYATSFTALERSGALKAGVLVGDLEGVDWRALERTWPGSGANWNHLRRAVSRFLSLYLGDVHHPLRRAVVKAMPRRKERSRVPDISPGLFWKVVKAAPEHVRPAFVTIAALGLRVGEYLRLTTDHLLPITCAVQVPGTKTEGSADTMRVDERLWPWVVAGVPSPVQYKWLRLYWKRALKAVGADPDLRLHDLRHAFGQWLANAGVAESRIQSSLRHASPSMTRKYTAMVDKGEAAGIMATLLLKEAV